MTAQRYTLTYDEAAGNSYMELDPDGAYVLYDEATRTADPGGLREAPSVPIEAAAHPEHYRLGWRHAMAQGRTADPGGLRAAVNEVLRNPATYHDVGSIHERLSRALTPEATAPDTREDGS